MHYRTKQRTIWTRSAHLASAPFIYSLIIPLVMFDAFLELYHRVCFPLYGITYVRRRAYIKIDRQKLGYLRWYEKINCMYCGYANGWFEFASAVARETEKYWCGIAHKSEKGFHPPPYHKTFLPYGDEEAFKAYVTGKKHTKKDK